jgi:hypothetical protein
LVLGSLGVELVVAEIPCSDDGLFSEPGAFAAT